MPAPGVLSKPLSGSLTGNLEPVNIGTISAEPKIACLGESWINLLDLILKTGTPMAQEGIECLGSQVRFRSESANDPVLERFGDREMIRNMEKVFFTDAQNPLGHSYANLMRGPGGRSDLQDIVDLLRVDPWTKRGVLTLCGNPNGKVPCLNIIQFLVRDGAVQAIYFARGQDIYRKFYADGLCVIAMARKVAEALGLAAGAVTGFIGSSHVYHADVETIQQLLVSGKEFLSQESRG